MPHKDGNNITAITALGNLFSVWFDENAACNIGETRSSERNTLPTATVRLYEPSAAVPPSPLLTNPHLDVHPCDTNFVELALTKQLLSHEE